MVQARIRVNKPAQMCWRRKKMNKLYAVLTFLLVCITQMVWAGKPVMKLTLSVPGETAADVAGNLPAHKSNIWLPCGYATNEDGDDLISTASSVFKLDLEYFPEDEEAQPLETYLFAVNGDDVIWFERVTSGASGALPTVSVNNQLDTAATIAALQNGNPNVPLSKYRDITPGFAIETIKEAFLSGPLIITGLSTGNWTFFGILSKENSFVFNDPGTWVVWDVATMIVGKSWNAPKQQPLSTGGSSSVPDTCKTEL